MKSTAVKKAIKFATIKHEGQFRKYTNEPYVTHPIAVARIVSKVPRHRQPIKRRLSRLQT